MGATTTDMSACLLGRILRGGAFAPTLLPERTPDQGSH